MKTRMTPYAPKDLFLLALLVVMSGCVNDEPMGASAQSHTNKVSNFSRSFQPFTIVREMALDVGADVKMTFVWVPALRMWVGKYDVTNEEYRRFKHDHNSGEYDGHTLNEASQPAVEVSFNDAVRFADWVNRTAKLPIGYKCRLPGGTNEWLTFAQCGDGRKYPWGDEMPPKYGNYHGQEGAGLWDKIEDYNDRHPVTCRVEDSCKNEWGLYGIGGNVWQWTSESYESNSICRVLRGASWRDGGADVLECSYRLGYDPSLRLKFIGFRLLLSPIILPKNMGSTSVAPSVSD